MATPSFGIWHYATSFLSLPITHFSFIQLHFQLFYFLLQLFNTWQFAFDVCYLYIIISCNTYWCRQSFETVTHLCLLHVTAYQ